MTIQEAIKSGKRLKRSFQNQWYGPLNPQNEYLFNAGGILATDWEIEIVKKELSAEDVRNANASLPIEGQWPCSAVPLENLIKKLGLE